ncbi:MAG: hypothetical protein LBB61_04105 [Treponema sp.]|nr:hypothetical protein [Treponema sp.]
MTKKMRSKAYEYGFLKEQGKTHRSFSKKLPHLPAETPASLGKDSRISNSQRLLAGKSRTSACDTNTETLKQPMAVIPIPKP